MLIKAFNFSPYRNVWNRPKKLDSCRIRYKEKVFQGRKNEILRKEKIEKILKVPHKFSSYDEEFAKVTSFESQLQSLKLRGFQRPFRPYQPPPKMEEKFIETCQHTLGENFGQDFSKIKLEGTQKLSVLSNLSKIFGGHRVPNSLIHTMTTLDKVFTFYSTPIDMLSPYDRLELGVRYELLPQNLHIQTEPIRFDPDTSTNDIGRISAFPRMSTILVSPEAQKKWPNPYKAKHSPYKNSKDDD